MSKNRLLYVVVLAALAVMASACSGSGPTGPSPVDPPPGPKDGMVTFEYRRPAGKTCLSQNKKWNFCGEDGRGSVSLDDRGWPDGYRLRGKIMEPRPDGSFAVQVLAPAMPAPGRLYVYLLDSWDCSGDTNVCNTDPQGQGLSANAVRLPDGKDGTCFSFVPPTVTAPATIEGC